MIKILITHLIHGNNDIIRFDNNFFLHTLFYDSINNNDNNNVKNKGGHIIITTTTPINNEFIPIFIYHINIFF